MNDAKNYGFITECPRDGQQGLHFVIPPEKRAAYINKLMQAGFDIIDFGSFVSPKAVPQMAESQRVLELIDTSKSNTKLLVIVGNERGAQEAVSYEKIDIVGFPYSISNTFLHKNINADIHTVFGTVQSLQKICNDGGKKLRVYMSMAFGNPYGDKWTEQLVIDEVKRLIDSGIQTITLSDTIGMGNAALISSLFEKLIPLYPDVETGIHLHSKPDETYHKLEAAWDAGCRHFDGVLNGFGGCPMTGYELLGNVNTLEIIRLFKNKNIDSSIDMNKVQNIAQQYPTYELL